MQSCLLDCSLLHIISLRSKDKLANSVFLSLRLFSHRLLITDYFFPVRHGGKPGDCPVTENVSDRLLRLPFFNSLAEADQDRVVQALLEFNCRVAVARGLPYPTAIYWCFERNTDRIRRRLEGFFHGGLKPMIDK